MTTKTTTALFNAISSTLCATRVAKSVIPICVFAKSCNCTLRKGAMCAIIAIVAGINAGGGAAAMYSANQAGADMMTISPTNVQQVGSQPQGLMIDSTGNLTYSTGTGASNAYFDPFTLMPSGGFGNVGSANGLDFNPNNGMHVFSGFTGNFGINTASATEGSTVFPSGLNSATATFAGYDGVGVFGFSGSTPMLNIMNYDGNLLGSTQTQDGTVFNGASQTGSNSFGAATWDFVNNTSSLKNFTYELDGEGGINLEKTLEFSFDGFQDGVYQGFHQDGNNVWAGYTINQGTPQAEHFLLHGQIPAPGACEADLNGDGVVNVFDLLTLLDNWGTCYENCDADLNNDGVVNVFDLLKLLDNWGDCR